MIHNTTLDRSSLDISTHTQFLVLIKERLLPRSHGIFQHTAGNRAIIDDLSVCMRGAWYYLGNASLGRDWRLHGVCRRILQHAQHNPALTSVHLAFPRASLVVNRRERPTLTGKKKQQKSDSPLPYPSIRNALTAHLPQAFSA